MDLFIEASWFHISRYLAKLTEECTAKEPLKWSAGDGQLGSGRFLWLAQVETREERMAKRQKEMEGTWFSSVLACWKVAGGNLHKEIEAVLVVLDGFHQLL